MYNKYMLIGDIVRHKSSERGMLGIIVDWDGEKNPVVQWDDGRCTWVTPWLLEVVDANW